MSEHKAIISWKKETEGFDYDSFNREHTWEFKDGVVVKGSSAPEYKGKAAHVDPEEALVAAVASCHMLTFLAISSKKGYVVESYTDNASGTLGKDSEGKIVLQKITLNPKAIIIGDKKLTDEELNDLHQNAHKHCFIANSVKSEVVVNLT